MQAATGLAAPRPVLAGGGGWWLMALRALGLLLLVAAITLLPPLQLVAAAVGGGVALVLLVRPALALPLLLLAVPFSSVVSFGAGDFNVGPAELLVALATLTWLAQAVRLGRGVLPPSGLAAVIVLMIGLTLFSATNALSFGLAIKEALKWLELLIVMLITIDAVREQRSEAVWLLGSLIAVGALEASWGVLQTLSNRGPSTFNVDGALRAYGHFDQPNPFAGYLSTILPLAAILALVPALTARLRLLAGAATLALLAGVTLSQSRGAQLGLVITALVMLAVWSHRTRLLLIPAGMSGLLVVVMAVAGFFPPSITDRVGQIVEYFGVFDVRTVDLTPANFAVVERMAHWQAGWYMFLDHPWLGVGAGNYAAAYPQYYLLDWLNPLGHAHNYYLNTMAELGVVGLAVLCTILWLVFRMVVRALGQSRFLAGSDALFWRATTVGILGSVVVFCTHSLFDNLFVHGVNIQLGFLLGMGAAAAQAVRCKAAVAAGEEPHVSG